MLERISDLPDGVRGLRASGTVSKDDYDRIVEPLLDEARRDGRRIRFLYHLTPAFTGFTAGGAWEDARIGMHYLRLFERCAVVTDKDWIRGASHFVGALLPCPVKTYEQTRYDEAVAWLASPAVAKGVTYRLLEDRSVLLVEPHAKLSVEDFDALAVTVDSWIDRGHDLHGIVVHARRFPGWETIGSLFRHIRFVRDHQKKVRRVAISADGTAAKLAPGLVENFISAEIQHFGYDEIDRALEWAAQGAGGSGRQQVES
jgi:hypothetical protein